MEGRADFFVAELVEEFGEAMLVMECIQQYKNGNERITKDKLVIIKEGWTIITIFLIHRINFLNFLSFTSELYMDFSLTRIISPNQKISKVKGISDMSVYEPSSTL